MSNFGPYRVVRVWLILNLILIVAMVMVGGVTRLTGSGLSMVEWKPIMGVVPPMSEAAWEEVFTKYQQFPQYLLLNKSMELSEFKQIFFWEYLHRLLGRVLGLVYAVPFFSFWLIRLVQGRLAWLLAIGFVLGGLQGVLGWYMVQSGLVNSPHVSHIRLAAHLMLALAVFAYLLWILLSLCDFPTRPGEYSPTPGFRKMLMFFVVILVLQLVYGAFMAGIKAGFAFNTFPKMLDHWVPPGLTSMETVWLNLFQNPTSIHFIHRCLGWALGLLAALLWVWGCGKSWPVLIRVALHAVAVLTLCQFLLGVVTLLLHVHVVPAVLHQVTACLVLGSVVCLLYGVYGNPERGRVSDGKT